MKQNKMQKRFMTLIEIMIVMFLITIITGLITYKVKDSIDYGKAFKTHQNIVQIKQILKLELLRSSPEKIQNEWQNIVKRSPLGGNYESLIQDGWKVPFQGVRITDEGNGQFSITIESENFEDYINNHDTWFENEN